MKRMFQKRGQTWHHVPTVILRKRIFPEPKVIQCLWCILLTLQKADYPRLAYNGSPVHVHTVSEKELAWLVDLA
jgi:hypothetical protein